MYEWKNLVLCKVGISKGATGKAYYVMGCGGLDVDYMTRLSLGLRSWVEYMCVRIVFLVFDSWYKMRNNYVGTKYPKSCQYSYLIGTCIPRVSNIVII